MITHREDKIVFDDGYGRASFTHAEAELIYEELRFILNKPGIIHAPYTPVTVKRFPDDFGGWPTTTFPPDSNLPIITGGIKMASELN